MAVTRQGLRDAAARLFPPLTNVAMGLFFGFFAYAHAGSFARHHRPSTLLITIKETLDAGFFLLRRNPKGVSVRWWAWAVAAVGTGLPMAFRPTEAPADLLVGQALQALGLAMQIGGIASLNRSFGLVAANRGVRSGGLYRVVRHPMYASYLVTHIGYVVNHATVANGIVLALATAAQVARIYEEERFLLQDPAYQELAGRVRWRLVPGIW